MGEDTKPKEKRLEERCRSHSWGEAGRVRERQGIKGCENQGRGVGERREEKRKRRK